MSNYYEVDLTYLTKISVFTILIILLFSVNAEAEDVSVEYSITFTMPSVSPSNKSIYPSIFDALRDAEYLDKLIVRNKNLRSIGNEIAKFKNLILPGDGANPNLGFSALILHSIE